MVKGVIGSNRDKFIVDAAVKFVTSLMVTFRCEERRKVLTPSGKYLNKDAKAFAYLLMGYMKANETSCTNYIRHLAILVRKNYYKSTLK
jgi:hypothetical protein